MSNLTLARCPELRGKPVIVVVRAFVAAGSSVDDDVCIIPASEVNLKDLYVLYGSPDATADQEGKSEFLRKFCQLVQKGMSVRDIYKHMSRDKSFAGTNRLNEIDLLETEKSFKFAKYGNIKIPELAQAEEENHETDV